MGLKTAPNSFQLLIDILAWAYFSVCTVLLRWRIDMSSVYFWNKEGIRPPPDRIKCVKNDRIPHNIKELRRIVGLLNWFRKYISIFSSVAFPYVCCWRKVWSLCGKVNMRWRSNNSRNCCSHLLYWPSPILMRYSDLESTLLVRVWDTCYINLWMMDQLL